MSNTTALQETLQNMTILIATNGSYGSPAPTTFDLNGNPVQVATNANGQPDYAGHREYMTANIGKPAGVPLSYQGQAELICKLWPDFLEDAKKLGIKTEAGELLELWTVYVPEIYSVLMGRQASKTDVALAAAADRALAATATNAAVANAMVFAAKLREQALGSDGLTTAERTIANALGVSASAFLAEKQF